MNQYGDIEEMRSKVILGIFNRNNTEFLMPDGPEIEKGTFVLRPMLLASGEAASEIKKFYIVNQDIMDALQLNEKEVLALARKNSMEQYPGEMKAITDFVNLVESSIIPDGVVIPQIYIITNKNSVCGAAAMFYQPELLENLSELAGKDLAVFPTDVSCVYCVPVNNVDQLREYQEMYQTAIEGEEHILSTEILYYDSSQKQLNTLDGDNIQLNESVARNHRIGGR